jgi:predicted RNA-binding Zn-ribbon protein involved in translation (DUF1610 family)
MTDTPMKYCAFEGCDEHYPFHRWGATHAHGEGWFLQNNGDSWCPRHEPGWVQGWRESRKARESAPVVGDDPGVGAVLVTQWDFSCPDCGATVATGRWCGYLHGKVHCLDCWTGYQPMLTQ